MPRWLRHFLMTWMLLAAAAPPPGMTCFLVSGADRAASDATGGSDSAAANHPTRVRGRNRVNPPARPDACWTCQRLAGDDGPARPSPLRPGFSPPRKADHRSASPAPFRSTTHRLRC